MTLFRVHEGPPPDKLAALREFLATSALQLGGGERPAAGRLREAARRASATRADFDLLQTVLLRSLSQAQYRPENDGHFGLAYEAYAHFTSPIRRYPDLLVHRAIKAALAGKTLHAGGHDVGAARRAHVDDRAARRRRVARRRQLAQVPLHAGPHRRGVRRHDQRRHELRPVRHARRARRSTASCTSPSSAATTSTSMPARHALVGERSGRHVPARRARAREGRARRPRAGEDRLHAGGRARRRGATPPTRPAFAEPLSRESPPAPREGAADRKG